ncbi:hypothetical protein ACFWPU_42730 [Streptomyces sp. NPDC058471]|uniref:hypothetical protein n=1 Tax=Streptomyces sp. NPDC058471 TaxID=3346516 RepID=UPI00365F1426
MTSESCHFSGLAHPLTEHAELLDRPLSGHRPGFGSCSTRRGGGVMQKRPSRPQRFAAVENDAIDSLPSILAVGLLTRLIRARDGEDVTVESLCGEYAEGEASLSKAMRALVSEAFVVKFKVQRATSEPARDAAGEQVLDESGRPVIKRGGSWYTTFSVDSHRFTAQDVREMVDAIAADGNVRAIRIEPKHLDPRKNNSAVAASPIGARPTPGNAGAGPTRENTVSRPAPAFPGAGQTDAGRPAPLRPGVGRAGALFKEETVFENSLPASVTSAPSATGGLSTGRERAMPAKTGSDAAGSPGSVEVLQGRQAAAQRKAATDFVRNLPGRLGPQTARSLAPLVVMAVTDGWTLSELRRFLISRCDTTKIRCPEVIYRRDLRDLPEPQRRRARDAPCRQHPFREAAECLPCRVASSPDDDGDPGHSGDEELASVEVKERAAAIRRRLRRPGGTELPNAPKAPDPPSPSTRSSMPSRTP